MTDTTTIIEPETERLRLRQWKDSDRPEFAKLNADPAVMAFYVSSLNVEQSNVMASKLQRLISERGWGFWAIETKTDKKFIGFVGLHIPEHDLPFTPCTEIGWRLATTYQGKGYATEAARAALDVAFTRLSLEEVVSFTSVLNVKSVALMGRLGMTNARENFEHPAVPEGHKLREHMLYRITRDEWLGVSSTRKTRLDGNH